MNFLPLILGGCTEKVDEPTYCKEEWLGDTMPLFRVPANEHRISIYEDILNNLLFLRSEITRNDGFGSRVEHQYILQLGTISSSEEITEYRKVFALFSCKLKFYNADQLRSMGWDVNVIFGGRPDEDIGAFELSPVAGVTDEWRKYYPEDLPTNFYVFYFNLTLQRTEDYIQPLIERCVSYQYAQEVFDEALLPESWQEDYYTLFLNSEADIPINGGDVIGEAGNDVWGSGNNDYRLSVFYLEPASNADFSADLELFMRYRGRVPVKPDFKSMAGHPIIHSYTNVPPATDRVDFLPQWFFGRKNKNVLALDHDQHPNKLVYRRLPSTTQQSTLLSMGVQQSEWEKNELTIYNPDQMDLDIIEIENPTEPIIITPNQTNALEITTEFSIPDTVNNAKVEVYNYTTGVDPIREIDFYFLDCVIVPVKFWKLNLNHQIEEAWYGNVGDQINHSTPDPDFSELIRKANDILSTQTNVYFKQLDPDNPVETIEVTTQSFIEKNALKQQIFIFDKNNQGHHQEIQARFNSIPPANLNELNVIFTWDILSPTVGNVPTDDYGFLYPYILIEVVLPTYNQSNQLISGFTEEVRGRILTHEFGHWVSIRNQAAMTTAEINHFDHDEILPGHYHNVYNIMQPITTDENEHLTTEQARIINQYAQQIIGSDPHNLISP